MPHSNSNINFIWSTLIIKELRRHGVDCFCLSPGSRSTPLVAALSQEDDLEKIVHFDERGMAFCAHGCSLASRKPTVIITTSGTAVVNCYPAIVEAFHSQNPLIILSADRPPELRSCGANQTIDQVKVFGSFVKWSFDLPSPTEEISPAFVLSTISEAIIQSQTTPKGPVHINCMFREPLEPHPFCMTSSKYLSSVSTWLNNDRPYTIRSDAKQKLNKESHETIEKILKESVSGLVVIGSLGRHEEKSAVKNLSKQLDWPILPDVTSGLRFSTELENSIPCYDLVLATHTFTAAKSPDVVLHLGGKITSKRLLEYLASYPPEKYLHIQSEPMRFNPLHLQVQHVCCDITSICKFIINLKLPHSRNVWLREWNKASRKCESVLTRILDIKEELTEPGVARSLLLNKPKDSPVFVANSMPIRDIDMFAPRIDTSTCIFSNRGASGIDGLLATAFGVARSKKNILTILIGDLAVLHDLNSLALFQYCGTPVVIIIVNNNGGGIFHFLPIVKSEINFEAFFGTPHHMGFESAARLFKLNYANPQTITSFVDEYKKALTYNYCSLIEVKTDRYQNQTFHQQLIQDILKDHS